MGFNNVGAESFVNNLKKRRRVGIVGVNIGKNGDTENLHAIEDYLQAFRVVYQYADYVAINVSSPNTPGLRDLQEQDRLDELFRITSYNVCYTKLLRSDSFKREAADPHQGDEQTDSCCEDGDAPPVSVFASRRSRAASRMLSTMRW